MESVEQDGRKFRFRIRFSKLTILPRDRLAPIEYVSCLVVFAPSFCSAARTTSAVLLFQALKEAEVFRPLARFAEEKLDETQRKTLAQSLLHIFLMYDRQAELILAIGNAVVDAGKDGELNGG